MLTYYDNKMITRLFVQEQRVSALFNELIRSVSPELRKWRENGSNSNLWVRNSAVEKLVDLRLNEFQDEFKKLIDTNTLQSWNLSGDKNDTLVRDFISNMAISESIKNGFFNRNLDALESFQHRVDNGFTLSDRVFQTALGAKQQLEFYLKSGIGAGQSADQISRDIRQLLQNPEKRFRRIRNKTGQLVPSQPMKDYHPGQGVYRSAYKNALRLAATETNMSYRLADSERWQQLAFVLGFEVKRSGNGKPCAICDPLVGKYPKTFVFPGWHPFCICIAVPILMNHEDSAKYFLSKYSKKYRDKNGISNDFKPNYITEIPKSAQQFFNNNGKFYNNLFKGNGSTSDKNIQVTKSNNINENLSVSERNIIQTEKALSIKKGKEMTFEEANELKGNINYNLGVEYKINCQSCVVANELRRRGFDVTAQQNTRSKGNIPFMLSKKTELIWIDPKTNSTPVKSIAGMGTRSIGKLSKEMSDIMSEVGRYHIDFVWKGTNSGHIITVEKLENGRFRFYDPQVGKIVSWANLAYRIRLNYGVRILRVDDKLINTELISGTVMKL